MERAALYRRALAPVMRTTGLLGVCGAGLGLGAGVSEPGPFIGFWLGVAGLALVFSMLITRRQALRAAEAFWSPPTRRVAQAAAPPLTAGLALSLAAAASATAGMFVWLPCLWMLLFGCALHAAGFCMPRGMKWLGWGFIAAGCATGLLHGRIPADAITGHLLMGAVFGGGNLAYSLYLGFTERAGGTP